MSMARDEKMSAGVPGGPCHQALEAEALLLLTFIVYLLSRPPMRIIPAVLCLPVSLSVRRQFIDCTVLGRVGDFAADRFSLCRRQRRSGAVLDMPTLSRLSHKRLMATFQVEAQRGEQDLYRCVTLSGRGAAVSNFGELIVRGELGSLCPDGSI